MLRPGEPPRIPTPGEPAPSEAHDHGPFPSREWILNGGCEMVLPHLRTIALRLSYEGEHFHISLVYTDESRPNLFEVALGDALVGAFDFLPLPTERTLMRLYVCADLGTDCARVAADDAMRGFAIAWLGRLQDLRFLEASADGLDLHSGVSRGIGFALPAADESPSE